MSLRRVTVLLLAAVFTVIGLVGGVISYRSAFAEANEFLDLQQRQIARYVGDLPASTPEEAGLPPHELEDDYVIEVTYNDGRPPLLSRPEVTIPDVDETGFSEFTSPTGHWRVFSLLTPNRTVQIGQQIVVRTELATEAAYRAILPAAVAIPLSWLAIELVVRSLFRRIETMASAVARRKPEDLSPLPVATLPREVRPLVQALNDLLGRLGVSIARQHAFLSDAAHELRTPITALTLQIGNLRNALGTPEAEERVGELETGARRVAALANQLLRIARYDVPEKSHPTEPVRLDELAREVVAGLVPLADARSIDLGLTTVDTVVSGIAADYRVLIEVLVDNAVRYAPVGGTVDVALTVEENGGRLEVMDDGPGVPEDLLPRLGERFYRGTRSGGDGSGLGLAIAQAIATRHGARLTFANRRDRSGFIASVVFPLAASPRDTDRIETASS